MSAWSYSMEQRFKNQPTLLKPSASHRSCCIFRAPFSLVQIDAKAYEPQIVSIGPYHHGNERLKMVEQHKPRFFSALLERTKDCGVCLDHYFEAVARKEKTIRCCYSEHLFCQSSDLVEMMVLDAFFIIEIFRIFGRAIEPQPDDAFLRMPWIFNFLIKDLLRMENQIPFFVLQELFDLSKGHTPEEANESSFSELALNFFNIAAQWPQEHLKKFCGVSHVKHLLDLFRLSFIDHSDLELLGKFEIFIGHSEEEQRGKFNAQYLERIPSATQLRRSGIKVKRRKGDHLSFLGIQFNNGVLQMPPLTLDDFMSSFFINCMAFEQCCLSCSEHLTSYVTFMGCLVNKEKDAELLSDGQILVNHLGSDDAVATFFNDLGKYYVFDFKTSYLAEIIAQVNRRYQNKWRVSCAGFKRQYFGSPWSFISAVAAFVLLVLTVLQAFYAVFAYYRPVK